MIERTSETRKALFAKVKASIARNSWKNKLMNKLMATCMADENLRTQLFRFIDVFPVLKTNKDVVDHFLSYVGPHKESFPWFIRKPLRLAEDPRTIPLAGPAIRWFVNLFAKHFIIDSADQETLEKSGNNLRNQGYDITWDILGEDVLSKDEASAFQKRYFDLIEKLGAQKTPASPAGGPDGFSNNVSIKLSSLVPKWQWDAINFNGCAESISEFFAELLRAARKHGVTINVDVEQYAVRDLTMAIFKRTLEKEEFKDLPDVGIVLQAYLADAELVLDDLLLWIRQTRRRVTIRLVKGAYWDCEVINAKQQHWPIPVLTDKSQTDDQFDRLTHKILKAQKFGLPVTFACASHNLHGIAYAMAVMEELGLDKKKNEFQVLYGMGDPIREAIVEAGYPVRVYTPYGELIPSMGYLVRRLLENTSQQSFLGHNLLQGKKKVKKPAKKTKEDKTPKGRPLMPLDYEPTAPTDFSKEENRLAMEKALRKIKNDCGRKYPLVIGGQRIYTDDIICSQNPADIGNDIGYVSKAELKHAELAMNAAKRTFDFWNETPAGKRADILIEAARIAREQRFELAALQVLEASKTWREADADVAEAIDFLEYYARMAVDLMRYQHTEKLPGESNEYGYEGRGVAVVISPWNFPMAIATGMCSAAIAAGNAVVFKPASATAVIGYKIVEILLQAGLPAGVISFLPGSGEKLGEYLIKHPDTVNILFTGSKGVGFKLIRWAGEAGDEQQTHCRRVIAEMGGKNAIIVDSTADLDQAVAGVIKSAFGYQGQKCSACSRVIVLDSIHDEFVRRLKGAAEVLKVGDPQYPGTDMGAVIDEKAYKEILNYIEIGKKEATLAYQTEIPHSPGWHIGPTIFTDVAPKAAIAQEEIFGPVLAVIKAKNFDEALRISNDCQYKLTGGIFTRTDEHIALARKNFKVGNLYINRGITGAIVGRQPFGGFGASGTGPKAGGPDYLLQLMTEKAICECLTRRGFSPELKN